MDRLRKHLMTAVLGLLLVPAAARESGEDPAGPERGSYGWYAGVQAGVPFGVGGFSSFGADKTRAGWSAGVWGGYRFNPVFSLEATAKYGQTNLSAQGCCVDSHLWLGVDGVRYNAPVLDMQGWDYGNLKSRVFMQHYGLQLNVNLLGLFNAAKKSRWSLELSPLVAAVGTKATVKAIDNNSVAVKGDNRWRFGAGGNLQAGYRVTENLSVGIYTGLTRLSGRSMDGMPALHKANCVWESGVRIGWSLGKCRKKVKRSAAPAVVVTAPGASEPAAEPVVKPQSEPAPVVEPQPAPEVAVCPEEVVPAVELKLEPVVEPEPELLPALPTVYFGFNSTRITYSELPKLQKIRDLMRENPEMRIEVRGWSDSKGPEDANRWYPRWRADAVKRCLVSYGIAADRIIVKGMGIDTSAESDAEARRADCVTLKTE